MAADTISKTQIDLIILHFLSQSDMYGYQISQNVSQYSDGLLSLNMGAMYASLYRLKESGYITDYEVVSEKRRVRVYYHLEEDGYTYLKKGLSDYLKIQNAMNACLFSSEGGCSDYGDGDN
jgi:PadR family transcriptional regulator PadR